MNGATLGDLIKFLERAVPLELAEEWDRSGLQIGDPAQKVSRALVALDPTRAAVEKAAGIKAGLLVTHHPLLMNPLKSIDLSTSTGSIAATLIRKSIALYSAHTNFDRVEGGVNDALANALGLANLRALTSGEEGCKVVVTVPEEQADAIIDAVAFASGGTIGRYDRCAFISSGTGTFRPREGANPYVGTPGTVEEVAEARVEMTVARSRLGAAVSAVRSAHPYEEPVIDIYPMKVASTTGSLGRVGEFGKPAKLSALAKIVAKALNAGCVRYVGDPDRVVRVAAVCGGSGASLWKAAKAAGADVLITGDVKHHDALDALEAGFSLIDAGHAATERAALPALAGLVAKAADGAVSVDIFYESEPFKGLN